MKSTKDTTKRPLGKLIFTKVQPKPVKNPVPKMTRVDMVNAEMTIDSKGEILIRINGNHRGELSGTGKSVAVAGEAGKFVNFQMPDGKVLGLTFYMYEPVNQMAARTHLSSNTELLGQFVNRK